MEGNKNTANVAILGFLFFKIFFNNAIQWCDCVIIEGGRKKTLSDPNYTNKFSLKRRKRLRNKIQSTTTEREKRKIEEKKQYIRR